MEEKNFNKSSSHKINPKDDLKLIILNISKRIRALQQERSSASFQHIYYYNSDPLSLENDLAKSCHSHSQSRKRLRKNKNYSIFCPPSYDYQISSNESSSDDKCSHFHDKKYIFRLRTAKKLSTTLISPT